MMLLLFFYLFLSVIVFFRHINIYICMATICIHILYKVIFTTYMMLLFFVSPFFSVIVFPRHVSIYICLATVGFMLLCKCLMQKKKIPILLKETIHQKALQTLLCLEMISHILYCVITQSLG